jgi:hypothetical protein
MINGMDISMRLQRKFYQNNWKVTIVSVLAKPKQTQEERMLS